MLFCIMSDMCLERKRDRPISPTSAARRFSPFLLYTSEVFPYLVGCVFPIRSHVIQQLFSRCWDRIPSSRSPLGLLIPTIMTSLLCLTMRHRRLPDINIYTLLFGLHPAYILSLYLELDRSVSFYFFTSCISPMVPILCLDKVACVSPKPAFLR